MTKPYTRDGQGSIWMPNNKEKQEKILKKLKEKQEDEPNLGEYTQGTFKTDELHINTYGEEHHIDLTGTIEDLYISIQIPIYENKQMKGFVKDIAKEINLNLNGKETGLFIKPEDFVEIRKKTTDAQGRVNLGIERAGKDVKVVILDE